jgi:hypothetical protein
MKHPKITRQIFSINGAKINVKQFRHVTWKADDWWSFLSFSAQICNFFRTWVFNPTKSFEAVVFANHLQSTSFKFLYRNLLRRRKMKKTRLLHVWLAILMLAALVFSGCGGGSSDTSTAADAQESDGQVVVSLTDAPGDFSTYTVDVLSLTLTKANGAQVSALPLEARIDFSQYTDMTEFLTAATVPSGVYVAATMTLDYTNADIWVENENGDPVQAAAIQDADGSAVNTLTATVRLEDRSRLVIAPGVPVHLSLDFNLEATNQVTFDDAGLPTVTVDPFIVADVNRSDFKLHRLRGLLNEISVDQSAFTVYLRPFYCALTGRDNRFGLLTVATSDATTFDIDGLQYTGQEGLTAMTALTSLTAVVAVGDLQFNPLRFEAREVYAGSSVPGGSLDVVAGSVVGRQGDTLTVKGATLIRADGTILFNDQATVQVGPATIVTRQFSVDPFSTEDISVGQRVTFWGALTDTDPLALTLDATQGYARMNLTTVRGNVTEVDEGDATAQLTVDVQSINHRRVADFDFSGTGIDATNDADPENYQISTGSLNLDSLALDAPVKARGFVQPFGQAPADFNAQTLIGVADVNAFMRVQWMLGSTTAIQSAAADGLVLNLDGVGAFHHLVRGWVVTDLTESDVAPTVAPRADGTGLFVLRYHGMVQVKLNFEDFSNALKSYLDNGAAVHKIGVVGAFDDALAVLTTDMVEVQLI